MTGLDAGAQSASLLGLEPHLTVPSKGDKSRCDLWFSLRRSSRGGAWDEAFRQQEANRKWTVGEIANIEIFPFTIERGWIVARGVQTACVSVAVVEQGFREIVELVNKACEAPELVEATAPPVQIPGPLAVIRAVVDAVRAGLTAAATAPVRRRALPLAARIESDYTTRASVHHDTAETVA